LRAVVVRWSRPGSVTNAKHLVTPAAIARAEGNVWRMRNNVPGSVNALHPTRAEDTEYESAVANKLSELFPSCPPREAAQIAAWTCRKHSGRVGRSAAARNLTAGVAVGRYRAHPSRAHALRRASHALRRPRKCRNRVRDEIEKVIASWERHASPAKTALGKLLSQFDPCSSVSTALISASNENAFSDLSYAFVNFAAPQNVFLNPCHTDLHYMDHISISQPQCYHTKHALYERTHFKTWVGKTFIK